MTASEFWSAALGTGKTVEKQHAGWIENYRTSRDISELNGQPTTKGSMYFASRAPLVGEGNGGAVVEMTYVLGGQRLVEGSHEIATREQIAAYFVAAEERREEIARLQRTAQMNHQSQGGGF